MRRMRAMVWRLLFTRSALLAGLLVTALVSQALGMAEVLRSVESGLLLRAVLFGALLGWLMATTRVHARWALPLMAAASLAVCLLWVAGLTRELVTLTGMALRWVTTMAWRSAELALIQQAFLETARGLAVGLAVVLTRWAWWMAGLVTGTSSVDVVASALTWSLLLTGSAGWAAWFLRRRSQPLAAIAPAGVMLSASLSYTVGPPYYLFWLTLSTLLMVLLVRQDQRERLWQRAGMDYSTEVVNDIWMAGAALSLALVFIGMLMPSWSIRGLWSSAVRLQGNLVDESRDLADALGIRESQGREAVSSALFSPLRAAGLPRRHLIGSGPELAELPVMEVQIVPAVEASEAAGVEQAVRYYWRALTYDRYTGSGWAAGPVQTRVYEAGEPAFDRASPGQRLMRQQFVLVPGLSGIMYSAGTPVVADRPYALAWRRVPDEYSGEDASTAPPADLFGASIQAERYQVDSLVMVASEARLRASSGSIPGWVREGYLGLPERLPGRVISLARQLTAGQAHPYDQAKAIETYLRRIPYTLDLPAPPVAQDVVDYFLFELQQGYCDYYATAMVVLARAAGLPARLVMGYAQGEQDETGTRFLVSQADAHSWVEVYLPGWGWVEFEPTGGLPPLERAADGLDQQAPGLGAAGFDNLAEQPSRPRGFQAGVIVLLAAAAAGGLWLAWWVDLWRLGRLTPVGTLAAIQHRLRKHGRRLDVGEQPGQTMHEFGAALLQTWGRIVQLPPEGEAARERAEILSWLTERYALAVYSRHQATEFTQREAIRYWRRLLPRLWAAQARRLWARYFQERK